jgi:hypothetical protein
MKILHAQSLTQIIFLFHVQNTQTSRVNNPYFFKCPFLYQMCTIPSKNWKIF